MDVGLALFPLAFAESTRTLTQVLAVLCLVSCLSGILGAKWATIGLGIFPSPFTHGALSGPFLNPNQLVPIAALGLAQVVGAPAQRRALYGGLSLSLFFSLSHSLVTLWWTDSRAMIGAGAIIALAASVRFMSLRCDRRVAAKVVCFSRGLAVPTFIGLRLFTNLRPWSRFFGLAGREGLWSQAIDYRRSSMLIGVGPDAFDRQWQKVTGVGPGISQCGSPDSGSPRPSGSCIPGVCHWCLRFGHSTDTG